MRDILPPESALWNHIEETARQVFRSYAYQEIRTPLVEPTELFARGVGTDTDIVTKEMYTWEDWRRPLSKTGGFVSAAELMSDEDAGQSLTLRPEATASVIRSYIENHLEQRPGVKKFYYIGPMFRRDRPQKGRFRQFYQIGAEAIGSESPGLDAEIIEIIWELLNQLTPGGFTVRLNSVGDKECRPRYLAALREKLAKVRSQLCIDCQRRSETNPLRVLDCKVPADQPIITQLPTVQEFLCQPCSAHFQKVQEYLRDRGVQFVFDPRLVRGLDYYTRTAFEFVDGSLGAQNAIAGGGRYDGLAENLGGPSAPGIGFSIGEDRLVLSLLENTLQTPLVAAPSKPLFVAWLGESAYKEAVRIAREIRMYPGPFREHLSVYIPPDAAKLSKMLELASRLDCRWVLMIGDRELAEGKYLLRDMETKEQFYLTEPELLGRLPQLIPSFDQNIFTPEQWRDKFRG